MEEHFFRGVSLLLVVYCELFFYINAGKRDTAVERLVMEDIAQRKRIISSIHDTSHLGVNRTQDMVAGKYYWPGLSNDIRAYVSCS